MYYLKSKSHEKTIPGFTRTDGTSVPERTYTVPERAIYKHHDFSRFYRGEFEGLDKKYQGMKVYTCKTLKKIKEIQKSTFDYCGEWFDIYDENGIVE